MVSGSEWKVNGRLAHKLCRKNLRQRPTPSCESLAEGEVALVSTVVLAKHFLRIGEGSCQLGV